MQYYTHREKMRQIGREQDLERINRIALKIAREVADDTGTLMAGGISNTNIYVENSPDAEERIRSMFEEQVRWSKEEGADYIIAETISYLGEAEIALDVIKSFNLPAVVTMSIPTCPDSKLQTLDGVPLGKAFQTLLDKGATVTGPNCARGPEQMLEIVEDVVKEVPPEKLCALPVMYRTTKEEQTFFELTDKCCPDNNPVYPHGLDAFYISVAEVTNFTKRCKELGLKYMGLCCGNSGNYTRAMAEAMGRRPPASRYHDPTNEGIDPLKRKKNLEEGRIKGGELPDFAYSSGLNMYTPDYDFVSTDSGGD